MQTAELTTFRRQKDDFFRTHLYSPLTDDQKTKFTGLSYYDPDPDLVFEVELELFEEQRQILMQTNQDDLKPFIRYGQFDVKVGDETGTLTLYKSMQGGYFLPFVDSNAGIETYDAGRYLDLEPMDLDEKVFLVDFNLAYNPYCAYNDLYICPLTPAENRLTIPIRAGEKIPQGNWVDKV